MKDYLFAWPDQLNTFQSSGLESAYISFRSQDFHSAESKLLSYLSSHELCSDSFFLLALLRLRTFSYSSYVCLIQEHSETPVLDVSHLLFLQVQYLLQRAELEEIVSLIELVKANIKHFKPLILSLAAIYIHLNRLDEAKQLLDTLPRFLANSLEALRLNCRIYERAGNFNLSLKLITRACERFPTHLPSRIHSLDVAIKARSQELTLPILNNILSDFGQIPELLPHLSQILLLQHKSACARRVILQNRIFHSISSNQELYASNIYNCYERLGNVDWLSYSPYFEDIANVSLPMSMKENLCLQAASLNLPVYSSLVSSVVTKYSELNSSELHLVPYKSSTLSHSCTKSLRIGWISGDICYHPVARFMLSLFYGTVPKNHSHTVLDSFPHGSESKNEWFQDLEHTSFVDLGCSSLSDTISTVRDHQFDVVVDLSGWTSNHFLRGFMQRLAPVQVSYLGYFASTGLNTMDYWLGDHSLFPQPITEWHTETIYRLNRCFISWSPPPYLPEASAEVVDTPASGGIRFGCFNHHRKFSDETLNVWGQILSSIPDSRLVLKGGQSDDSATSTLLSRRMRRAGLDPEKIIWIERTRGTDEHLKQYGLISP